MGKEAEDAQAVLDKLMPAINALAKQRGIEEGNLDAFVENVQQDDSLIEDAAAEAGMTVESYRTMEQLRQENSEELLRARKELDDGWSEYRLGLQQAALELAEGEQKLEAGQPAGRSAADALRETDAAGGGAENPDSRI